MSLRTSKGGITRPCQRDKEKGLEGMAVSSEWRSPAGSWTRSLDWKKLRKSSAHDDGPEILAAGQAQQGRPVGAEEEVAQALSPGALGRPEAAEKGNGQWR